MTRVVAPGRRRGAVTVPSSKSQMHRLLLAAALGTGETELYYDGLSRDISATVACLRALGAQIVGEEGRFLVRPLPAPSAGRALLPCGESGSTLRFLLPVAGALGAVAEFRLEGRLAARPLAPLDRLLEGHGMFISRTEDGLCCSGRLHGGRFEIPGNISSQYVTGLLYALPLLEEDSVLTVTGPVESVSYITMTEQVLRASGIRWQRRGWTYEIPGRQRPRLPDSVTAEGDYSSAAFFLAIGALGEGVTVRGLLPDSPQGDRAVLDLLRAFGANVSETPEGVRVSGGELHGIQIDAAPIPDLIPALAVVAAAARGETRIENAGRLRLKESDRIESTAALLRALGGQVEVLPEGLVITGGPLTGGTVDPFNDHRIAMAAAVAAGAASGEVVIPQSECTEKSYPRFWEDLERLEVSV